VTTAAQRRRRAKKRRAGRPDLDVTLCDVACDRCGTVQENRASVVFLGAIEPCGHCGNLYGLYA
jgi:hypothetical protein